MKGRMINVTRFFVQEDIYSDESRSMIHQDDITMILVYPPGEIPLQRFRTGAGAAAVADTGLFFYDILPIEVYTQFKDQVEIGDYILQVIKDEVGHKIGILLKITNMFGAWDTELVWRKGWAAPESGDLPAEVLASIQNKLANEMSASALADGSVSATVAEE